MTPGSEWYNERVRSLRVAADTCADPETVFQEGLEILKIHRGNFDADGPRPKWLQIIWWEFPSTHWTALREGGRMNFLRPPVEVIHPNAKMDQEQTAVAVDFVDELLGLGVLRPYPVVTTAPMFIVPKEGQPG